MKKSIKKGQFSNSPRNQSASIHTLMGLAWPERRRLALAALFMGLSALATAAYAYLVGPVLRSLFIGWSPADLAADPTPYDRWSTTDAA